MMGGKGAGAGRGKLRLLVALDLPESVCRGVDLWRREVLTDPALRLTNGPRMTLLFLGHRPRRDAYHYLEAIQTLCASAPAPSIELCDAVPRGPRASRPSLFALPAPRPAVAT
jgi:hypothetical protein